MKELVAIARLPRSMAHRLEARCRDMAAAAARRGLEWILRELTGNSAFYRFVDGIVDYLVRNPALEELVRRQSATLVGEAVDDLRTGAARADSALDRLVWALRRRMRRA